MHVATTLFMSDSFIIVQLSSISSILMIHPRRGEMMNVDMVNLIRPQSSPIPSGIKSLRKWNWVAQRTPQPPSLMLVATGNIIPTEALIPRAAILKINGAITSDSWPLYFHGETGSGKSCAAACVAICWPDENDGLMLKRVVFATPDMLTEWGNFLAARDASLLVIDDVGRKWTGKPWIAENINAKMFELLNLRAGKPTIVTGNKAPAAEKDDDLSHAIGDGRLASRILAGGRNSWIEFPNTDRRITKK